MQDEKNNINRFEEIRKLKEIDNPSKRERQLRVKKIKTLEIVKLFISKDLTIQELADRLLVSRSTVQRYLNEDQIIIDELGEEIYNQVKEKLLRNKQEGFSRGGQNYSLNNQFTKDEFGKFTGSKKR